MSGKKVTPEKALTLSAVWRAVSLISETVGSLSFEVVRRLENGGRVVERVISSIHWSTLR